MNIIEIKKAIYRNARSETGLTKPEWGRLFALGNTHNTFQVVNHKENPTQPGSGTSSKGVNMPEALAAQLLVFIHNQGFDINRIAFDDQGHIVDVPKKAATRAGRHNAQLRTVVDDPISRIAH